MRRFLALLLIFPVSDDGHSFLPVKIHVAELSRPHGHPPPAYCLWLLFLASQFTALNIPLHVWWIFSVLRLGLCVLGLSLLFCSRTAFGEMLTEFLLTFPSAIGLLSSCAAQLQLTGLNTSCFLTLRSLLVCDALTLSTRPARALSFGCAPLLPYCAVPFAGLSYAHTTPFASLFLFPC